jgi:vacuolar-type H+-ATPase subunit I/STV1
MVFGILLYGSNARYNKNYVELLIVFPLRLIFFTFTIGYMVFLIITKWLLDWPITS